MALLEISETEPLYIIIAAVVILLFWGLFKMIGKRNKSTSLRTMIAIVLQQISVPNKWRQACLAINSTVTLL
ncbi:MAG: hypothetical protein V8Q76_14795 [Bacteroides intestinalis]